MKLIFYKTGSIFLLILRLVAYELYFKPFYLKILKDTHWGKFDLYYMIALQ